LFSEASHNYDLKTTKKETVSQITKHKMIKQSLVQGKLNDLINNGSIELKKSKISESSNISGNVNDSQPNNNGSELLNQYNMPQWPRVQLDKQITSNLTINSKPATNSPSPNEPGLQKLTNNNR